MARICVLHARQWETLADEGTRVALEKYCVPPLDLQGRGKECDSIL